MPKPLLLGIDTSQPHCALAIYQGGSVLFERIEPMPRGQSERIFPLITEALSETQTELTQFDGFAVGIGPGNFTGIRIAVSLARGFALATGKPAIGVSTFDVLAEGACEVLLDAKRDMVYVQRFGPLLSEPHLLRRDEYSPELPVRAPQEVLDEFGIDGSSVSFTPSKLCEIAATRLDAALEYPAKPLYLRGADAALPKEAPPLILHDR